MRITKKKEKRKEKKEKGERREKKGKETNAKYICFSLGYLSHHPSALLLLEDVVDECGVRLLQLRLRARLVTQHTDEVCVVGYRWK